MKIVVLAGGTSTERTVSITSGTGICKALRQKGHQAILVDIFAVLRMWTGRIRFRQSMMWTQHQNICQHLTTGLNR